ncbi:MAG: hypothetical protein ACKO96_44865 [Flammeovirgaceae bacterium]
MAATLQSLSGAKKRCSVASCQKAKNFKAEEIIESSFIDGTTNDDLANFTICFNNRVAHFLTSPA